jgi:hypothetical protein
MQAVRTLQMCVGGRMSWRCTWEKEQRDGKASNRRNRNLRASTRAPKDEGCEGDLRALSNSRAVVGVLLECSFCL